jgi:dTDP-glucose 4,6-dehydratase
MKILVTGGAGFIGGNYIRNHLNNNPNDEIVNFDKLTYAGKKESLADIEANPNYSYSFIKGDIVDRQAVKSAMQGCEAIINFAAESHVDRSIEDATEFIRTDVMGAFTLLDEAREQDIQKFVQISTDEVYGQIEEGSFTETSPLMPRNPYSASKTGADRLAYSFHETYGMNVVITRSSNNYGPFQYPEKVVPVFITNLMQGKKVPLYGEGKNVRDWLYVLDNCDGIEMCLKKGSAGEVYNIGGGTELQNIELTHKILGEFGKGEEMIERVADRLGHDLRYSLDCTKIENELGWKPKHNFDSALHETVEWYKNNEAWWKPLVQ